MKKKIRVFAILLAVIMCFTTMPMATFAAETEENEIMPRLTIFNQSKYCSSAGSDVYYFTTPYDDEYTVILRVEGETENKSTTLVLKNQITNAEYHIGTDSSASRRYSWSASQTFRVEVQHFAGVSYTVMIYN